MYAGFSLLATDSAKSNLRFRPEARVAVAPPSKTLSALRPVFEIPFTSVAYKAAGSLAALKNLPMAMLAVLATPSLTFLMANCFKRLALACVPRSFCPDREIGS